MTAIRSWSGYAKVLRELQAKPQTVIDLAAKLGCAYGGLQILVTRMCALGLVHEHEWVSRTEGSRKVPAWAFGKVGRVPSPYTGKLVEQKVNRYRHRPALIAFATLIRSLSSEPRTALDLATDTGCSRNNISRLMAQCEELGLTRVCGWEPREDGMGRPAALWTLSNGKRPRAPRPPVLTQKEKDARHNAKRRVKAQMQRLSSAFARARASASLHPEEQETVSA